MNQGIIRNFRDIYKLGKPEGKLQGYFNVLTVRQPYASMLVSGVKKFEFRNYCLPEYFISTPILIHSGAKPLNAKVEVSEGLYNHFLNRANNENLFGCILGVVVFGETELSQCPMFYKYRWPVREYYQLIEPIRDIKGNQGLWKITF
jgi:hypothetical protein